MHEITNKIGFISDMDGNTFQIPDPDALDKASLRRLEVYI